MHSNTSIVSVFAVFIVLITNYLITKESIEFLNIQHVFQTFSALMMQPQCSNVFGCGAVISYNQSLCKLLKTESVSSWSNSYKAIQASFVLHEGFSFTLCKNRFHSQFSGLSSFFVKTHLT